MSDDLKDHCAAKGLKEEKRRTTLDSIYERAAISDLGTNIRAMRHMIDALRGGLAHRTRYKDLKPIIYGIFDTYYGLRLETGGLFYRGRLSGVDERYDNVREIGARESSKITDYGRCHSPGQSTLYLSYSKNTVLSEVRPFTDSYIHIARYAIASVDVALVGFVDSIRRTGGPIEHNDEQLRVAEDVKRELAALRDGGDEKYLRIILGDAYMADVFTSLASRQADYWISSLMTDFIFLAVENVSGADDPIDGILYGSVAHRGGFNIALRPRLGKKLPVPEHVEVIHVQDCVGYGIYACKRIAQSASIDDHGQITWEEVEQ